MTKRILDLGCGIDPFPEANILLDINQNYLDMHKANGIELVRHDLNKFPLPFETDSMDAVLTRGTIEHLTMGTEELFKEINRILTVYGHFHIEVPNTFCIAWRLMYLFCYLPVNIHRTHVKHFSYRSVMFMLKNTGFTVRFRDNWKTCIPFRNSFKKRVIFDAWKSTHG